MQQGNPLLAEIFQEAYEHELIQGLGWELNPEEEYEFSKALQKIKDFAKKGYDLGKRGYRNLRPLLAAGQIITQAFFPKDEPIPMLKDIAAVIEQDKRRKMQDATEQAQAGTKYRNIKQKPNPEISLMTEILMEAESSPYGQELILGETEHTKGARPSTKGKHQKGQTRKIIDRGGEKGDERRDYPRKKPNNWKGPWPPNQ